MITYFKDIRDRFEALVSDDTPIYTVTSTPGCNITKIQPGMIGNKFYRTKGHKHINGEGELYKCISGCGYVVQITENGRLVKKFEPDDRVMILPYAYHYVENIGDEPLVFMTSGPTCEKDYTMRG